MSANQRPNWCDVMTRQPMSGFARKSKLARVVIELIE